MTNTNAAQAMELREARNQLMVFNGKECQNTHSQTEDRKRSCDLDRRLVQSMEDLECAKASIVFSESGIIEMGQNMVERTT